MQHDDLFYEMFQVKLHNFVFYDANTKSLAPAKSDASTHLVTFKLVTHGCYDVNLNIGLVILFI